MPKRLSPDDPGQTGGIPPATEPLAGGDDTGDADQSTPLTADAMRGMLDEWKNGMFAMARKIAEDTASKATETQADPEPPIDPDPKDGGDEAAVLRREMRNLQREMQFNSELAKHQASLDPREVETLTRIFKLERPADPVAWLQAELESRPTPKQPQTPDPAPGHPAPKGAQPLGDTSADILTWTREDYDREFQTKAPYPANKYDIRNRPFYADVRRRAEARLKDVEVDLLDPEGRRGR